MTTPNPDTPRAISSLPPDTVASPTHSRREPAVVSLRPEDVRPTANALSAAVQRMPLGTDRDRVDALALQLEALASDVAELRELSAQHDRNSFEVTVNVDRGTLPPPSATSQLPARWRPYVSVAAVLVPAVVSSLLTWCAGR